MRWFVALILLFSLSLSVMAQESPVGFRLVMDSTDLQTGQAYTVSLRVDAVDIWAFSVKIKYDPSLIYVVGSKAGMPIMPSAPLNGPEGMMIFDRVQNGYVEFVYSRLSPAESANYSDIIGTFQIYPLKAGSMLFKVNEAEASRLKFKVENGERLIDEQLSLPTGANELTLTIKGDTVKAPDDPTPTPTPSPVPSPTFVPSSPSTQAVEATPILLSNDIPTALPTATPVSLTLTDVPTTNNNSLLGVAIGLVLVALIGFVGLWWSRRSR